MIFWGCIFQILRLHYEQCYWLVIFLICPIHTKFKTVLNLFRNSLKLCRERARLQVMGAKP